MKRWALAALALLASPAAAQDAEAIAAADAAARGRITKAIEASGFAGVYAVYQGPRRIAGGSIGEAVAGQPGGFTYEQVWPWASVTKQVLATMAMQEVDAGRLSLDAPASRYLPQIGARAPTLRQLLQHRDYAVLGALLAKTTRTPLPDLFAQRIAGPLGLSAHYVAPEPVTVDEAWTGGLDVAERAMLLRGGLAGGLVGTAADLATFDRALLAGSLLTQPALATLWKLDPGSDYVAPLARCAAPVRLIEQRAGVGRFQVRNLIAPELGLTVVLLTNRGDFAFGEVRQGKGPSHDILSAAACA